MDEGSNELEAPDVVTAPPAGPAPRNPRQVRARRRRRRRQFGTVVFVLVAIGVFAAAYFAVTGDDDSSQSVTSGTGSGPTSSTTPPFFATYKVTTGLNVRQGPGTSYPNVGIVEEGRDVTVVCVVEGEPVTASNGTTNTQWLSVAGPWPTGYVSSAYVVVGDDLRSEKIPTCEDA